MSYYWLEEPKQQIRYARCDKCEDKYVMYSGRYSQRRSCRVHRWVNGYCKDCREKYTAQNALRGCYHISIPLCCGEICTIS